MKLWRFVNIENDPHGDKIVDMEGNTICVLGSFIEDIEERSRAGLLIARAPALERCCVLAKKALDDGLNLRVQGL